MTSLPTINTNFKVSISNKTSAILLVGNIIAATQPAQAGPTAECVVGSENETTECGELSTTSGVGGASVAVGSLASATGGQSTAVGAYAESTEYATAVGRFARATAHGTAAVGASSGATGDRSSAFGNGAGASGEQSVAIGYNTNANGDESVAIGGNSIASEDGVALGHGATAGAVGTTAVGDNAQATGISSTTFGWHSQASATGSIAIGAVASTQTDATNSIAIGSDGADNNNTVSPPSGYTVSGVGAIAFGVESIAIGADSFAAGSYGIALGSQSNGGTGAYGIAIGYGVTVGGNNSISVGRDSQAIANNSMAVGRLAKASGLTAFAAGYQTSASGLSATAIGRESIADGRASFAAGLQSNASGVIALAAGYRASASGTSATAIGSDAIASGQNSIAQGRNAQAIASNSVAIGLNAVSDVNNRITIGSASANYQLSGLAGTGIRTLVVDENGVVSAVSATTASPVAAFKTTTNSATFDSAAPAQLLTETAASSELITSGVDNEPSIGTSNTLTGQTVTVELLESVGVDLVKATKTVEIHESATMNMLMLHNTAMRGNWLMTDRYQNALADIQADLRITMGDADFDLYLIATDQPNQVIIEHVLGGSPAAETGVITGDRLYSYADERIFNASQVRIATSTGEAGQLINITVERDGQLVTLQVARGVLGALVYDDYSALPRGFCNNCGEYI